MLDKTFDPKSIESVHYKRWEQSGAFACNPQSKADPYCIMIPPPNVTGTLCTRGSCVYKYIAGYFNARSPHEGI